MAKCRQIRRECFRECKPASEFYYYRNVCKECMKKKRREWLAKMGPEKARDMQRQHTAKYFRRLKKERLGT